MKVELEDVINYILFLRSEEGEPSINPSIVQAEAKMEIYDNIIKFLEAIYVDK